MYDRMKIVICFAGEAKQLHRMVATVCEEAWDAGAELRLRRLGERGAGEDSPDGMPASHDLDAIPPATVADLEWGDVALFGISLRDGEVPPAVEKLVTAGALLRSEIVRQAQLHRSRKDSQAGREPARARRAGVGAARHE